MVEPVDAPEILDDFELGQHEVVDIKDCDVNKSKLKRRVRSYKVSVLLLSTFYLFLHSIPAVHHRLNVKMLLLTIMLRLIVAPLLVKAHLRGNLICCAFCPYLEGTNILYLISDVAVADICKSKGNVAAARYCNQPLMITVSICNRFDIRGVDDSSESPHGEYMQRGRYRFWQSK